MGIKYRDESLDIVRGVAAILVILGHTIQIYEHASENPLYNFITALQMPLFMMVSGFAIGYSKRISNIDDLKSFLKKRTISLLLPWMVWSILSYIFLSSKPVGEYILNTVYHMEAAYWFLFSLWCIDLIFGFSFYLATKYIQKELLGVLIFCSILNLMLLLIGIKVGITFLGIKYTTYYLVFFILGWLLYKYKNKRTNNLNNKRIQWLNVILLLFFAISLSKISIIDLPDTPLYILYRLFVSLSGCIIVFYYCSKKTNIQPVIKNLILKFSKYSLELYIVQCILLKVLTTAENIQANTTIGFVNIILYSIIIIYLCFFIINILNCTQVSRFFFFGKTK